MTPQEAHLRLMATTPSERITTHTSRQVWGRAHGDSTILKLRLKELERQGMSRKQMRRECACSKKTIIKYLGKKAK